MAGTSIAVKLDEQTRERLQALGELKDRSPHWLMKQAILEYLETQEMHERQLLEDRRRWETYVLTGDGFSQDEMERWVKDLAGRQ